MTQRWLDEWFPVVGAYLNIFLWALIIPQRWPIFARHLAGDWSDVEEQP